GGWKTQASTFWSGWTCRQLLRSLVVVSDRRDLPPEHHRVVFVDDVVTVHRVAAEPVAEAEEEGHVASPRQEPDDVLARHIGAGGRTRSAAVAVPMGPIVDRVERRRPDRKSVGSG